MNTSQPHSTDCATFYEELRCAVRLLPDEGRVMAALNRTYRRFLDRQTCDLSISLVGPFAQTDYLLKEHRAPHRLRLAINGTRSRFRRGVTTGYAFDLENLARFISLITGEAIPDDLLAMFLPTEEYEKRLAAGGFLRRSVSDGETQHLEPRDAASPAERRSESSRDYLRFILDSWDENFLYGHADQLETPGEQGDEPLRVYYGGAFSYLRTMLFAHAQFNLIRPHLEDGIVRPQYIILEPDYLVNITSVAHCFATYSESPYVYLLQKLMPNAHSEHTILGNFAGQLLDEELHGQSDYAHSVEEFFHHNASVLLSTPLPDDFHERARLQRQHIHEAVCEVLPREVGAFRREDVLLEPSFYSEMLGLSGRMDMLQHDMKVLIEQKSGKGAFVPGDKDPDTPRPAEQHYVQMLLYMLLVRYNYPEAYRAGSEGMQAFLLYSKYAHPLVKLDFAPDLVNRALCLRNGIAWLETHLGSAHHAAVGPSVSSLSREGVAREAVWSWQRILDPLTPEMLNTKRTSGNLWNNFTRPELAALIVPIHNASPLERAYYYRMLDFVSREHLLSKVGNKQRQNAGFAAAWHDALTDKRQAGNIYDRLQLAGVSPLTFRFTDTANNDMANFRVGDIVALYPYTPGTEPDLRRSMVHRATIEYITADSIQLQLRAEQTDSEVFYRHARDEWAIEHDFMEASYSSLYSGLHAFLSAPRDRRDLLLLQREPRIDHAVQLRGDYGPFNELMLKVKQARDLFLIIGPPGTGKTSYGMLNTLREELLEVGDEQTPPSRLLLLSYTNRAVDEICSKLLEEGIDFLRFGNEMNCSPDCRDHLFERRASACRNLEEVRRLFLEARVMCATTSTMSSHVDLLRLRGFSLCIIDEASQILEPHLMALLSATLPADPAFNLPEQSAIRKFVMIGDHKQLPAVVQQSNEESAVTDPLLLEVGLTNCRLSLFERLLHRYREDESVVYLLTRQGRMHHDIALFPNEAFYMGRLTEVPLPHQVAATPAQGRGESTLQDLLITQRVAFVDVPAPTSSISDKVNQPEADLIAQAVLEIYGLEKKDFSSERTVGIIVPYRNQIATVRNTIDRLSLAAGLSSEVQSLLHNITIDTVERYQGSQRRYILYGFTVQQPYQLDFLTDNTFEEEGHLIDRKLNVAMTRAQEHLLMVGNATLLRRAPVFSALLDSVFVCDNRF